MKNTMRNSIPSLAVLIFALCLFPSCSPAQDQEPAKETTKKSRRDFSEKYKSQHPLGGWHCPDNLGGFPPVNVRELDEVPAISDRLPTQEETRNSQSLIFIDTLKYPNAKALPMDLPRVAKYYSRYTHREEEVIVIQAIIVDQDTIVGFRFPSGGNGSAWYGEMEFLDTQEVRAKGNAKYIHIVKPVDALRDSVWKAVTRTEYADVLRVMFQEQEILRANWSQKNYAELNYSSNEYSAAGMVADMWGTIYLQLAFDYSNYTRIEKILILPREEDGTSEIQIVIGPFDSEYSKEEAKWKSWAKKVISNAEEPGGC